MAYISGRKPKIHHQNTDKVIKSKKKLFFLKQRMKLFAPALLAVATASEKKVPPRHPLNRIKRLTQFAAEWCGDNLTDKQADNWVPKFERNAGRMERRFELCGYYEADNLPHGGPERKRRDTDDDESDLERYDKTNPIRGIQQITKGFSKWAQRYIATCKVQPDMQVARMSKWFGQLGQKLADNQA